MKKEKYFSLTIFLEQKKRMGSKNSTINESPVEECKIEKSCSKPKEISHFDRKENFSSDSKRRIREIISIALYRKFKSDIESSTIPYGDGLTTYTRIIKDKKVFSTIFYLEKPFIVVWDKLILFPKFIYENVRASFIHLPGDYHSSGIYRLLVTSLPDDDHPNEVGNGMCAIFNFTVTTHFDKISYENPLFDELKGEAYPLLVVTLF